MSPGRRHSCDQSRRSRSRPRSRQACAFISISGWNGHSRTSVVSIAGGPCRSPRRRRAGTRPTVRPLSTRLAAAMLGGARAPARNVSASKQAQRPPRSGSSVIRRAALRRVCGARTVPRSPTLLGLAARVPVGQSPLELGIPALSPTQLRGPVGLHATCGALLHVPFLFVERVPPTYRRCAPTAGRSRRMNTPLAYLRRMSVLYSLP